MGSQNVRSLGRCNKQTPRCAQDCRSANGMHLPCIARSSDQPYGGKYKLDHLHFAVYDDLLVNLPDGEVTSKASSNGASVTAGQLHVYFVGTNWRSVICVQSAALCRREKSR